jgi:hypothetical protein
VGQCFGQDGVMGIIIHSFVDIFCLFQGCLTFSSGYTVAQLVEAMCCKPDGRGFDSRWVHCDFFLDSVFWLYCGPGVDSPSNRNEYQGYLLECKGGRCIGLTDLPPSCADSLEIMAVSTSWSPNGLSRLIMG